MTGNNIAVDSQVARLYSDDIVRSSITSTLRPVAKPGITSLIIKRGAKNINEVKKSDLPVIDETVRSSKTSTGANVLENTREAILRVARANFENGKWGFSDGSAHFSADIQDEGFKAKLDAREIGFYKDDVLRVILKTTQVVGSSRDLQTSHVIETVLEHIHAPQQQPLGGQGGTILPPPQATTPEEVPSRSKRDR